VTVQRPVHHEAGAVRQVTHQTGDVAAR